MKIDWLKPLCGLSRDDKKTFRYIGPSAEPGSHVIEYQYPDHPQWYIVRVNDHGSHFVKNQPEVFSVTRWTVAYRSQVKNSVILTASFLLEQNARDFARDRDTVAIKEITDTFVEGEGLS